MTSLIAANSAWSSAAASCWGGGRTGDFAVFISGTKYSPGPDEKQRAGAARDEGQGASVACRVRARSGPRSARWRWLVQDQPVQAQLPHRFDELLEVDRFADVAVGAESVTRDEVPLLTRRGQDHHGQETGAVVGTDAAQDLEPVDLGELEIEEDDFRCYRATGMRARAEEEVEGFGAVVGHLDLVLNVVLSEGATRQRLVVGVVFDEQDHVLGRFPGHERVK